MSSEIKGQKHIFDGDKGESIFYKPFLVSSNLQQLNQENAEMQAKIAATGDDRSYVLVEALICEYQIDRLLELFMPGYKKLSENKDFTFGLKIDLLQALRLVPVELLSCARCVKNVRNEFAHHLDLNSLAELNQERKNTLTSLYNANYRRYGEGTNKMTVRELFGGVTFLANMGLRSYRANVAILREVMASEHFVEQLRTIVSQRDNAWTEAIMSEQPQGIEEANNARIERFRGGVAKITSLGPDAEVEIKG